MGRIVVTGIMVLVVASYVWRAFERKRPWGETKTYNKEEVKVHMQGLHFFKKKAGDEKAANVSSHLEELGSREDWRGVDWKGKDDAYWKKVLPPMVYKVTRQGGTEKPFTGKYESWKQTGTFICSNCGQALFSSGHKFDSGTGWPSFWEAIDKSKVVEKEDRSFGMLRTEISCSRCGSHLGHVFNDGPEPTGLRYCINSVSLNFKQAD